MTNKELEKIICDFEWRIRCTESHVKETLKIDQAKKRDYIVRTDYLGKLTHKQLKEDFKAEIETALCDLYKNICNNILNYKFYDGESHIHILDEFHRILKDYELKQIVIDTYGEKKCEK